MEIEFQIIFSFTVNNGTDGLAARLNFSGESTISLAGRKPIQIASNGSQTPPLTDLRVAEKKISVQAAPNPSGDRQSITITVPFKVVGGIVEGNLPFDGVEVEVRYQILETGKSGPIGVGNFKIEFPV